MKIWSFKLQETIIVNTIRQTETVSLTHIKSNFFSGFEEKLTSNKLREKLEKSNAHAYVKHFDKATIRKSHVYSTVSNIFKGTFPELIIHI